MGDRRFADLDPAVASIIGGQAREPEREEPVRKTTKTPHERERSTRKMSLTWPDGDWLDDVQEEARRIGGGCRPSDVLVLAYAHYRALIEAGEIQRPHTEVEYWQRAGEAFRLPWEP